MSTDQVSRRSEAELRSASNDLYYEFWMFVKLASGLATGILGESVLNNALLESFAAHTRVLLDFLYDDNPGENDVSALDFVANREDWILARPRMSRMLKELSDDVRHRVGKEIGALPYDRHAGVPERKPWPFMQIAKELNAAFDAFLETAPEHFLGPRWKDVSRQRQGQNGAG